MKGLRERVVEAYKNVDQENKDFGMFILDIDLDGLEEDTIENNEKQLNLGLDDVLKFSNIQFRELYDDDSIIYDRKLRYQIPYKFKIMQIHVIHEI